MAGDVGRFLLRFLIFFLILIVVVLVGYLSLRWIPWFTINEIKVTLDQEIKIPNGILRITGPVKGRNSFSLSIRELEASISTIPMVDSVRVRRRLPDSLEISVRIYTPPVVIAAADNTSSVPDGITPEGVWIIKDDQLVALPADEVSYYGTRVPVIFVDRDYALVLQRYGVDEGFRRVIALVQALGNVGDTRHALITSMKYDNNNSRGFGRLVMEIPSCSARLWVREAVSARRIMDALAVIVRNHAADDLSFLGSGTVRYDLYSDALVKRSAVE